MTSFDRNAYGPMIANLLREDRLSLLDPGAPDNLFLPELEKLGTAEDFAPRTVVDDDMAEACRSGLWLYHEFLDPCHEICQNIHTPEGSYWHAILHRREPDYDNSKYWFRRVGNHPIFEPLRQAATALARDEPDPEAQFLKSQRRWDPFAFVDLCEAILASRASCEMLARQVQKREWELLFDWCYRHAVGA
jgi:hypothetical protein